MNKRDLINKLEKIELELKTANQLLVSPRTDASKIMALTSGSVKKARFIIHELLKELENDTVSI